MEKVFENDKPIGKLKMSYTLYSVLKYKTNKIYRKVRLISIYCGLNSVRFGLYSLERRASRDPLVSPRLLLPDV